MMALFRTVILIVASSLSLSAETWVRGSVILHSAVGEVSLVEPGVSRDPIDARSLPVLLDGMIDCQLGIRSSVFLSTSNRMFVQVEGEGSVSVERFEQVAPEADRWSEENEETGQSRMIYNFRSGLLALDSTGLDDFSQCLIETPLGRIASKRALAMVRIDFDPRSQIFDFVIACSEGQIRFTDNRGENFTLRSGQRLAGAGASAALSIEVGEITDQWIERVERFRGLIEEYSPAANSLEAYQPKFVALDRSGTSSNAGTNNLAHQDTKRRPIVIERASAPSPVTPFRGEIPPPSAYRADIF